MRRRGGCDGSPPVRLLRFRAEEWPDVQGWSDARREWVRSVPTLAAANALYGPGFAPPPQADPRLVDHGSTKGGAGD